MINVNSYVSFSPLFNCFSVTTDAKPSGIKLV